MSKYIVEIPDEVKWGVVTCRTEDGFYTRDFDSLEELNSDYINEHFSDLQDTAYQRGLDDAWEAARKIVEMADPPYWGVFNEYKSDLFGKISAAEAIAKLKAYEEQKADDKIEVGDEVIFNGTTKCLVVRPETVERFAVLIDSNGNHHHADHSECKKTGRHFNIKSILEAMKHD